MTLDVAWVTRWMLLTCEAAAVNREYLIDPGRQIGGGDHGENLGHSFSQVVSILGRRPCGSVQDALKVVAKTLVFAVGGAAGSLYGATFLRAVKACALEPVNAKGVAALILAALEGIQTRGKAEHGEKTMVNIWGPASDATAKAASRGANEIAVLKAIAAAAAEGAAATEPMKAMKGRASCLGERSTGYSDPGAISSSIILAKALEATKKT